MEPTSVLLEREKPKAVMTSVVDSQHSDPAPSRSRIWKRVLIGLAAVTVVAAGIFLFPKANSVLTSILEWTKGMGPWGIVYLAAVYAVACVLFLPGSILTLGAGFAFGLTGGTVATVIGSLLGVSASFLLGRTVARKWVEKATSSHPRFLAIDRAVGREGFKIVLLTRLSPVFPFNLLNYGFGVTRVRFRDYFLGSWIGMFPGTVLYVYLGTAAKSLTDLASGNMEGGTAKQVLLAAGLVATVLVTVVITRVAKRALKEVLPDGASTGEEQGKNKTEIPHA